MIARNNPFATHRLDALPYRPQGERWEAMISRLKAMGWRGAVVGPEGSGKTALLHDLVPRLEACGFSVRLLRLDEDHPRFPDNFLAALAREVDPRLFILLDGAELLRARDRRAFLRATALSGGLVVTTRSRGILPTWIRCETSPCLLHEIAGELLREDGPDIQAQCAKLFAAHGGNIRRALLALYDRWAETN